MVSPKSPILDKSLISRPEKKYQQYIIKCFKKIDEFFENFEIFSLFVPWTHYNYKDQIISAINKSDTFNFVETVTHSTFLYCLYI